MPSRPSGRPIALTSIPPTSHSPRASSWSSCRIQGRPTPATYRGMGQRPSPFSHLGRSGRAQIEGYSSSDIVAKRQAVTPRPLSGCTRRGFAHMHAGRLRWAQSLSAGSTGCTDSLRRRSRYLTSGSLATVCSFGREWVAHCARPTSECSRQRARHHRGNAVRSGAPAAADAGRYANQAEPRHGYDILTCVT